MNWFLKLSFLTLVIHLSGALDVIPTTIFTQNNGSYTIMLKDDNPNIKPKKCYLKDNKITYEIDLTTSGVPLQSNDAIPSLGESKTNILTSLGYGICGFRLDNLDKNNYVETWNISFIDENGNIYIKTAYVKLTDIQTKDTIQYIKMGTGFSIECGNYQGEGSLDPKELLNCELYHPFGTLVSYRSSKERKCDYNVRTSKYSDIGNWKCVLTFKNYINQVIVNNYIGEKEKVVINLWRNETDMHINFGCLMNNLDAYNREKNYCEMIRPDGKIFALKEGLAIGKYTALGTQLSKAICGMEIKKPLEEKDKGLWRCAFKFEDGLESIGGFIHLPDNSSTFPPWPPEIPSKMFVLQNENIYMTCRVQYSSPYCYMRGPTGTIYPVENNLEPSVGVCKFIKQKATLTDTGTWSCGFGKKPSTIDDVYTFEVVVLEKYDVKPVKEVVEVTSGSDAYLQCSTRDDLGSFALQYCRFQNPHGEIYNIDPEDTSSNRISYFGLGLKYGYCGIKLKPITYRDIGMWTCITRIGNNFRNPEVYAQIKLQLK